MIPPSPLSSLSDRERFPALAPEGLAHLHRLREHPFAPRFNFDCGDRLTLEGLAEARRFRRDMFAPRAPWRHGEAPAWLAALAARCLAQVPFYRKRGGDPDDFFRLPTTTRNDLASAPWEFIPDDLPAHDVLTFSTSGSTGPAMAVPSSPVAAACYLPALEYALARHGIALDGGRGRTSIVLVCAQRSTLTYASLSTLLDGAGFVKINLAPGEWRHPDDPVRFLDDLAPEILTGDPFAFARLAELPLRHRPKAMVSTAMALTSGTRAALESRFSCPVIDVYSLTESRMIAVATPRGHEIVPHRLYVEILASDGTPRPPGERGEIVLSGGFNDYLPLLRYRTGDFASLDLSGATPALRDMEGRPPVRLEDSRGRPVNTIDVTKALTPLPLAGFHLRQRADRSIELTGWGALSVFADGAVRAALAPIFGDLTISLRLDDHAPPDGKPLPFSSELPPDEIEGW